MTYGELKASLARMSIRTDLTSDWPEFIRSAHDRIVDGVALMAEVSVSGGELFLPEDFSQIVAVWFDGAPVRWSVDTDVAYVSCDATGDYTARLLYRPAKAFFADDDATNTVLTDYPWLYRYGALAEAGRFMRDSDFETQNERRFREDLDRVSKASVAAAAQNLNPRPSNSIGFNPSGVATGVGAPFDFEAYYESLP